MQTLLFAGCPDSWLLDARIMYVIWGIYWMISTTFTSGTDSATCLFTDRYAWYCPLLKNGKTLVQLDSIKEKVLLTCCLCTCWFPAQPWPFDRHPNWVMDRRRLAAPIWASTVQLANCANTRSYWHSWRLYFRFGCAALCTVCSGHSSRCNAVAGALIEWLWTRKRPTNSMSFGVPNDLIVHSCIDHLCCVWRLVVELLH